MLSPAHGHFLTTFGSSKRIEMMLLILRKPRTVSELIELTGLEQSAVSHHLQRLKTCNFVKAKVMGKRRLYSVNARTIGPLLKLMNEHVQRYCAHLC